MSPVPAYRYGMPSAIVVGAGVFGSAIARRLALEGWEVTLVEQESPGWAGSSSGGESRLVRFSHGTDSSYTRSAWQARDLWRKIDPSLLAGCGLAWFAYGDEGWEADSERTLREEGIPVERLEPSEAAKLFPSLGTDDLAWVLYEPEACVVFASRAVAVLVDQALEAGAQIVRARAQPHGARVGLEAADEWAESPGWVDYDRSMYGHGSLRGYGFKAACDAEGETADPDALGDLDGSTENVIRPYLRTRFPALADAPVRSRRPCPYELTADTHFVAAPHPEQPSVWLVGGGSGHGFKHAPALAERMLGWLRGDEGPDPRFALGPRSIDRSLRTAGVRATRS
jgi:sarcosine oxidase